MAKLGPRKAKKMLRHGKARGHKLTDAQRRYIGAMASGKRKK